MDIYEKLPVPYGLIRYGVAPDNLGAKVGDSKVALYSSVFMICHLYTDNVFLYSFA